MGLADERENEIAMKAKATYARNYTQWQQGMKQAPSGPEKRQIKSITYGSDVRTSFSAMSVVQVSLE